MRNPHITNLTYSLVAIDGRLFHRFSDGTVLPVIRGGDGETVPLADLIAQAADLSGLSDEDLATLDADITAAAETLAASETLTDEDLATLEAASTAVQAVRAEDATRTEAAADRAARADAALAEIRGETPDPEGDPAPVDPDAAEDPPAAEPAAPAPPEGDPAPVDEAETPEAIAAAAALALAAPPVRRAPITRVNARRPAAALPVARSTPALAELGLVASANAPGVVAGSPITTYDDLAQAFVAAAEGTRGYRHGPPVKVPVVRCGRGDSQYPEEFQLGDSTRVNGERIRAAKLAAREGGGIRSTIAASGGVCAPLNVRYDMPTVGVEDRPVRDSFLLRFGADRGGIRTLPHPVLGDVDGSVAAWTNANDINPTNPTVKPCLTMTCPDEDETITEALTRCLETGNFRLKFFAEQVEAWMRLIGVHHARFAEERLLATIAAGSTAVTSGQVLGTTRDVLSTLDRAIAVWRYNYRLNNGGAALAFGAPIWLRDQIRTDIARQLPVGTTDETLALADSKIATFFASRGVDPVWLLDGESGQRFTTQGAGPLQGWPSTVKGYLAPVGDWLFLDGGSLDFGLVRDASLNETNDVRFFAETFEGAHLDGPESWTLTFDCCPDGSTSSSVDISPCTTGS